MEPPALAAQLEETSALLTRVDFSLDPEREVEREALKSRLVDDLAGHAARLRDLDAPLLVVVGGVTGAGKSTLVNSVVGREVTRGGVLRPTTTEATLVVHPTDGAAFAGGSARIPGVYPAIVQDAALPEGLALLDAPDVDSVSTANRELADRLLDAADVWLYCTESRKYADRDSMAQLVRAERRRTVLAVALTQVRPTDTDELRGHFLELLGDVGLADVPLFVVPYADVSDGQLPGEVTEPLRAWLTGLADPDARRATVLSTLQGALRALPHEVRDVAAALEAQDLLAGDLRRQVEETYGTALRRFGDELANGVPIRDEVLARWQAFIGTGRTVQAVQAGGQRVWSWARDAVARIPGLEDLGPTGVQDQVRGELTDSTARLVVQIADSAAAEATARWSTSPAGRALLGEETGALRRSDAALPERVREELQAWQDDVVGLVTTRGLERRTRSRILSYGLNAAATALLVAVLFSTGGLTGAETGVATAASAANQVLLQALLGRQNLAWLTEQARERLLDRVDGLLAGERRRFTQRLDPHVGDGVDPDRVRAAADQLARVR